MKTTNKNHINPTAKLALAIGWVLGATLKTIQMRTNEMFTASRKDGSLPFATWGRRSTLVGLIGILAITTASAVTLSFERKTANAGVDIADQLSVEIVDAGSSALFLFKNSGSFVPDAVIGQIYIEDGNSTLSGFSFNTTETTTGVAFGPGATPLGPSGVGAFTVDFSQGADSPAHHNGVDIGEMGAFDGALSSSFADVEAALISGDLRIALHVISIGAEGESDAFLSLPSAPEPSTSMLGLIGVMMILRRRVR